MKYSYYFKEEKKDGISVLSIVVPKEIELVATLLESDIKDNPKFILDAIGNVMSGCKEIEIFYGNITSLDIRKDKTIVYNQVFGKTNSCEIETVELIKIIKDWVKEYNLVYN